MADATRIAEGTALAAFGALRPIIDAGRPWADEHARMAPEVCQAAREAGLFLAWAPTDYGGAELPFPELIELIVEVGAADPTVGWHLGNSAAISFASAHLEPELAAEVFSGPSGPFGFSIVAGGRAVATDGGYVLDGRWPNVTGVLDAPWVGIGAVVHDGEAPRELDGNPDVRMCIVPTSALRVEKTWDAAVAMRGTGSHAATADGVFVPEGLAHAWTKPLIVDRPMYRMGTLVSGPVFASALSIGVVRRALDATIELASAKISAATGSPFRDSARVQGTVGAASAAIAALRAGLVDAAAVMYDAARAGRPPAAVRGRLWSTAYWTFDRCRELASDISSIATSSVYLDRNPVEAAVRDVHAIAAGMEATRGLQEAAGRVQLGLRPAYPFF
ncbi:MAG: hypothetical protein OEY23_04165 [Acidimicrobiia bacterium]|nr:hypothetical protein [Acidimicrobiia bacterium]